jgi:hypothetical protein
LQHNDSLDARWCGGFEAVTTATAATRIPGDAIEVACRTSHSGRSTSPEPLAPRATSDRAVDPHAGRAAATSTALALHVGDNAAAAVASVPAERAVIGAAAWVLAAGARLFAVAYTGLAIAGPRSRCWAAAS